MAALSVPPSPAAVPTDAFAPILAALATMQLRHGDGPTHGLAPRLVTDAAGWTPASALLAGAGRQALHDAAQPRWPGSATRTG